MIRHPGSVGVIAVDENGRVPLVRQFRSAVGDWVLEMPAGTRDVDGEPPEETARRELAEEVGLIAQRFVLLGALQVSPGNSDEIACIFLATGLTSTEPARAGPEERWMSVEWFALEDIYNVVASDQPIDVATIAGVALALRALRAGA
jgi:8-oxo-dGDP phosphatase